METSGGELLLNLIHYQVGHQGDRDAIPSIEAVYPFREARCAVRCGPVKRISLEPERSELEFDQSDGLVRFTVPSIEYMATVRVELK